MVKPWIISLSKCTYTSKLCLLRTLEFFPTDEATIYKILKLYLLFGKYLGLKPTVEKFLILWAFLSMTLQKYIADESKIIYTLILFILKAYDYLNFVTLIFTPRKILVNWLIITPCWHHCIRKCPKENEPFCFLNKENLWDIRQISLT